MKIYSIFIKQNNNKSVEDVLLVKEGFNFFAFLFNIFWFLYSKLWLFASISFVLINVILTIFSPQLAVTFLLLLFLLIGLEANNLLLYRFQREGYYFVGYSMGNDKREAEAKFLESINKENNNNNIIK